MNWFEVVKENRLVTDTVTHTKVDEKKEPEKEDGRCKEKLRNILFKAWDGWRETQAQNDRIVDDFDHPMNMMYQEMPNVGITVMAYGEINGVKLRGMVENKENFLEEVPEETCCHILELMQRLDNQKLSDAPEGPHSHSTENNLLDASTNNSRGQLDGNFLGFVDTRVVKEFHDDGFDRLDMEDLEDYDQVTRELSEDWSMSRELVFACFKTFRIRMGWALRKGYKSNTLSFSITVGQIRRLEHWDCGECEEDRERMMRDTDDKFSELIG